MEKKVVGTYGNGPATKYFRKPSAVEKVSMMNVLQEFIKSQEWIAFYTKLLKPRRWFLHSAPLTRGACTDDAACGFVTLSLIVRTVFTFTIASRPAGARSAYSEAPRRSFSVIQKFAACQEKAGANHRKRLRHSMRRNEPSVARLFEGRSPEFRSHRRMSPWNSNRWRVCDVFPWQLQQ